MTSGNSAGEPLVVRGRVVARERDDPHRPVGVPHDAGDHDLHLGAEVPVERDGDVEHAARGAVPEAGRGHGARPGRLHQTRVARTPATMSATEQAPDGGGTGAACTARARSTSSATVARQVA